MKRLLFKLPWLLSVAMLSFAVMSCSKDDDLDDVEVVDPVDDDDDDENNEYPGPDGPVAAFPGAEGGGMYTTGGRGGTVYVVTSLEDPAWAGPGTLRYAVERSGARVVVFNVAGTIRLTRALNINNGNITIAGQTAPGGGITIRDFPVQVRADNVIIRFIRFRMGDERAVEGDAFEGQNRRDIIIDHCSISWGTDEVSSFYDNTNFTMQWSIISESLNNSVHEKGLHGYGGIWGGKNASFHHNLIAHHRSRTPRMNGSRYSNDPVNEKVDFRNNVLYNWGDTNGAHAGEGGSYNIVNNYYKPGPVTATKNNLVNRIFEANGDNGANRQPKGVWGVFYVNGNYIDDTGTYLTSTHRTSIANANSDNWNGFYVNTGAAPLPEGGISSIKSTTEFNMPFVTTHTASEAYTKVLARAGASLSRDAVDIRIVNDVETGTYQFQGSKGSTRGLIDSQSDVGGWPELSPGEAWVDTDGDGIPDTWEVANGLNPNDASDAWKYNLDETYPNIEVYLNSIVSSKFGTDN